MVPSLGPAFAARQFSFPAGGWGGADLLRRGLAALGAVGAVRRSCAWPAMGRAGAASIALGTVVSVAGVGFRLSLGGGIVVASGVMSFLVTAGAWVPAGRLGSFFRGLAAGRGCACFRRERLLVASSVAVDLLTADPAGGLAFPRGSAFQDLP